MKRWRNEKEDAIYAMRFASQQMLIDKLQQKNKQLKDNWIDLKAFFQRRGFAGDEKLYIEDILEVMKIVERRGDKK